jgi:ATP-binding cassette subfamily F protein 3
MIESIFRPELKPVEKETEVILKFPEVDYLNPPVMTMDEVSFRYPNTERIIFQVRINPT